MRKTTRSLAAAIIVLGASLDAARADDVTDAIEEARKAYDSGDITTAKQALDVATQLLAQRNADGMVKFLPKAPAGWSEDAAETDASAAAIFGGGTIARRRYAKGDTDVTVQLLSNSPILLQMTPMFSNAQMLGAMGRVFRIKGKTAVVTRDGDIQMVLGKTFITIDGSAKEAEKRLFLDALDLAAIEGYGS